MIVATDKGVAALSLLPEEEPLPILLTGEIIEEAIRHARSELRGRGCINITEDAEQVQIGAFSQPTKIIVDRKAKSVYRTNPTGSFSLFHSKRKADNGFVWPFEIVEASITRYLESKGILPQDDGDYHNQVRRAAGKAVNTAFRSPMRDILKQFSGAVWSRLDQPLLQVVIRAAGFSADSLDYSLVWQNEREAAETFRIAPGVMPIWLFTAQWLLTERHGHDDFSRAYMSRSYLERKIDRIDCRMPPIIPDMQRRLQLSPRAWRYLTRLNPMWSRTLIKQFLQPTLEATLKGAAYMLEILAEAETVPSYSTFRAFISHAGDLVKTPHLVALSRAAFAQSKRERRKLHFVRHELSAALEWFKEARPELDANQQKQKWPWFQRQREEWRARELARKRAATQYKEWPSLVEQFTHGDYELLALTNSHALCEEAHAMHHCVDQYAERCARGAHRLFSLRLKGTNERVATAEIVNLGYHPGKAEWKGHNWTRSQVKGKYNQPGGIPKAAMEAVEALKERYQELAIETNCPPPDDNDTEQDEILF